MNKVRDSVLRSLSAIGALSEAKFYTELFSSQDPEKFAIFVVDPRCLKNPLLETLISNIRILYDLGLLPTLLIGTLDDNKTSVRFQAQRLSKALEDVSVKVSRLNTASYQLIAEIKRKLREGRVPVLDHTDQQKGKTLIDIAKRLKPNKIIFLQPSGGITQNGNRVPVINLDKIQNSTPSDSLSKGQTKFMEMVTVMAETLDQQSVYVIASPLNLLAELFTTKGSGTLIRRAAHVQSYASLVGIDQTKLKASIESSFGKKLKLDFFHNSAVISAFLEKDLRGGAILTDISGSVPYLSKFWVKQEARGEGLARDVWDAMVSETPAFFWRSRRNNPFNDWYMQACDGMQVSSDWRVFWKGLSEAQIPGSIIAAAHKLEDFEGVK